MPLPFSAFLPLIGQGINAVSNVLTNNRQVQQAQDNYARQRADSLADWNMMNQYNSPKEQMKRFKEAGLNPNLIYGQMSNSPAIKSPDLQKTDFVAPQVDTSALDFLSMGIKKQQTDLVESQIATQEAQAEYIRANTLRTLKDTDLKAFSLMKSEMFLDYDLDYKREQILSARSSTALKLGENERKWLMSAPTIQETLARIAKIKEDTTTEPWKRDLLKQQVESLKIGNSFKELNLKQQTVINEELKQTAVYRNLLLGKQITSAELDNDIKALKGAALRSGLSETFASDIISDLLSMFGRKGTTVNKTFNYKK